MNVPARPLVDVTRRALAVLTRELGAADTFRFVNQFTTGLGDYTAEREQLFAGENLEQIVGAIQRKAVSAKNTKRRKPKGRQ